MYSKSQLAKKYIQYFLKADNGKGHGIHSPFVFDFVINVLNDEKTYPYFEEIEAYRKCLKKDENILQIEDFGAGSRVNATNHRKVSAIAKSALKPKKYSQLLSKIVHYYQPNIVVELGTCLGVTTSYLAKGANNASVYTMEGASQIAAVAELGFKKLKLDQISLLLGNMDDTLPSFIQSLKAQNKTIDFAFIDGNHREEPTVRYFNELLSITNEYSILVFDDIHWSKEMEAAWNQILQHPSVTLSIDLFFIGLVFFRKENMVKQHFTIRY